MAVRKIIQIDEEKCTGCGECILTCAEAALEIVDGKAKLVGDLYCDGLGACLSGCPEDALHIIERDAEDFEEEVAMERARKLKEEEEKKHGKPLACGCPGSSVTTLEPTKHAHANGGDVASTLGHWPIKLQLLGPGAPFLENADFILMADCVAASYPNLHRDILAGKAIAMGCPKLDNVEAHIDRLAEIIKGSKLKSLTVMRMEVPCCKGFVFAAQQAIEKAGSNMQMKEVVVSRSGHILD